MFGVDPDETPRNHGGVVLGLAMVLMGFGAMIAGFNNAVASHWIALWAGFILGRLLRDLL